jgi:sugar phosphate isomerase/epimerase
MTNRGDRTSRRTFVRLLGGTVAGVVTGASCAPGDADADTGAGADTMPGAAPDTGATSASTAGEPGVQLYTVRSEMQRDFEGTLARVGEIGYREVEFAGYYDRSAADVRRALDAANLRAPAAHTGIEAFERDADGTLSMARDIGHTYVIVPYLGDDRRTADGYRRTAEQFDTLGARAAERGLRLGYHNHDFEFAPLGDTNGLEILLAETDPANVVFEMDLFWVRRGGADPLDLFTRHPGRFHLVHVKDMAADGRTMVDVGQGVIDFAAIFARAEQGGIRHYFVEHDNPQDPMASIRQSHDALAALLAG